jgi:hypothetical protein
MITNCYYCSKIVNKSDIKKHGLHEKCFSQWFGINLEKDFENLSIKQASQEIPNSSSGISKINQSFFHGAFKKYSAEINGEQYILKVSQTEFPELPKVEWISNKIAHILGLNIPEFYLINLENVQSTFVTKNFMTKKHGSNLIHIYHFVDRNEEYSCKTLLRIIKEKCGRITDIREFVLMCLFDSLIGNHDRHGRNIGLIQSGPSRFTLSPTYDNPSYVGIEAPYLLGADLNPKGKISTSTTNEPTFKDYVTEFNTLEYGEITNDFIKKIKSKWVEILSTIDDSDLSESRKNAFKNILNKRAKEF